MSLPLHPTDRRPVRRLLAPAVALSLALGLAACGDSADEDEDATPASPPTTAAPADGGDGGGDTIEVSAVDYGFVGIPTSVEAGTTLALTNDSEAEVHEIVLFRLPEGETRSVQELLMLGEEEAGQVTGPPKGVSVALPGEEGQNALGDLTVEEPGRYVMVCFVPTGADPQTYRELLSAPPASDEPPEIPGGPPHFTQGMVAEFTVD
jgi:hypothetical protein